MMVEMRPLRGWRFAASATEDLGLRLAPPYDVISPQRRRVLASRHPHNIVHLDLPDAAAGDDCYARAAAWFRRWQVEEVLAREAKPALYVLEQSFQLAAGRRLTRTGLIGRLLVVPWGEGVLPHERTFPHAKADRLALLAATRAEFNPVFFLYSDPLGEVLAPLAEARRQPPAAISHGDDSVDRLWVVTDPQAIAAALSRLTPRTLYVADGHHRYETALAYRRQAAPTDEAARYVLACVVAMEDPGLVILATHRCLHDVAGFDAARLLRELERHFELVAQASDSELIASMAADPGGARVLGLALPGQAGGYLLRLRANAVTLGALLAQDHPTVADLDVAALQTLVLGPLFGIGRESHEQRRFIDFEPDAQAALAGLRAGRYQAVFLLTATRLSQLRALADAGQVAPPKATYFYPKLPSGMVIYDLDNP
jgi:uncharacterized protein (DUF1015 family)